MAEFTSFWAATIQGSSNHIILICVQDCLRRGLFAAQTFADLVTVTDPVDRRGAVLRAVQGQPPLRQPEEPVITGQPLANLHYPGREVELLALNQGFPTPDTKALATTRAALHGWEGMH